MQQACLGKNVYLLIAVSAGCCCYGDELVMLCMKVQQSLHAFGHFSSIRSTAPLSACHNLVCMVFCIVLPKDGCNSGGHPSEEQAAGRVQPQQAKCNQ